jgi:hypothetical protein
MASSKTNEEAMVSGSWESARERKMTIGLDATPAERLAWLEEAILFAYRAGALPRIRELQDERPHDT